MTLVVEPVGREPHGGVAGGDTSSRELVGRALLVGFVLQLGLRGGLPNALVAIALGLTVALLWADERLRRSGAKTMAALAALPALFLAVRSSPWLAWSNLVAVATLSTAAALHARNGSILDTSPGRLLARGASGLQRGLAGLAVVRALAPHGWATPRRDHLVRATRGLVVVVPVLVALVALLASADAVFASLFAPDVDTGPVLGHLLLTVLLASIVIVLSGSTAADEPDGRRTGTFGVVELTTMLGLVGVVLGMFVVSQLVALTGAGDRLLASAGVTPAEYARSGFFQLCWATALLLGFVALVRAVGDPTARQHPIVVALGAAVPTLALGLVAVSLRRMALYDDAFGLTMLRLWVVGAAIWMGAVLVMTAARNLGVRPQREWLLAGSGGAALVLLLVANVLNPEALVARHNLDRARAGEELDIDYLATLSDDVVPAVADALDRETDPVRRGRLRTALRCGEDATGAAALNLAARRANDERAVSCRP